LHPTQHGCVRGTLHRNTGAAPATFRIIKQRKSRYWEVRDPQDEMVCITVYKKGAAEVIRRLAA
jgi:hypothetical protein